MYSVRHNIKHFVIYSNTTNQDKQEKKLLNKQECVVTIRMNVGFYQVTCFSIYARLAIKNSNIAFYHRPFNQLIAALSQSNGLLRLNV